MVGGQNQSFCCVQCFTSNGTWTCPTGTTCIEVCVAGGGGGGGGGAWINSGWGAGGGGGGGGGISYCQLLNPSIPSSVCIVLGAGGLCGPAATFNTCGSPGGNGQPSCFGNLISAAGGGFGQGGKVVPVINPPFSTPSNIALGGAGGCGNAATGGAGGCGRGICNTTFFMSGTPGCNSNAGAGGGGGFGRVNIGSVGIAGANGVSSGICGFFPNNNGGAGGNAGRSTPANPCATGGLAGAPGLIIVTSCS